MGYIYKIACNVTDDCYYGRCNGKYNRMSKHTARNNNTASKQIIDRGNYTFSIIEDNLDYDVAIEREYFYITTHKCVNITIPWTESDSKIIRHRREESDRYAANPELYKQKALDRYYTKHSTIRAKCNEKIQCECGKLYTYGNKSRHFKTHKNIVLL